jgi:hypothetical protein
VKGKGDHLTTEPQKPISDIRKEALRVANAMDLVKVPARLIGGVAIWLRCPSAEHELLRREYMDLDFLGLSSRTTEIKHFLVGLGYQADKYFNSLHGRSRLLFHDNENDRQVDVLFDEMNMCHKLDFRSRINVNEHTLPIADLLLTKLQIVEVNPKDMTDLFTLFSDHPIGDQDGEMINGRYIAQLTSGNWGLYRTIQLNLDRVIERAAALPQVGPFVIERQVHALRDMIESEPKSVKWKVRARLGDRVPWYELPEEVRRS